MATIRYPVRDPDDREVILGYFDAEEGTAPEELKELAAKTRDQLVAKRVAELSKPNVARKIVCQACGTAEFDTLGDDFARHMQEHNKQDNLGEEI
jgi:hypothetical protein